MPFLEVNGGPIHYDSVGQGPTLFLIAGTGFSGKTWWPPSIKRLSTHHRVITWDLLAGTLDERQGGTNSHVAQAQYLAARIPEAELLLLDGMMRGVFWQDPDRLAGEVESWLHRHGLRTGPAPGRAVLTQLDPVASR